MPASIELVVARAAACPADGMLRAVAEAVVARERRYQRPVSRVTLTFWRADFDRATLRPSERPTDLDLISRFDVAVRLRWLAVHINLPGLASLLGF